MPKSRQKKSLRAGLSLVELLMILTLLGIVGSIGVGALFGLRDNAEVKGASKIMASLFQEARSKARHSAMIEVGSQNCAMQSYRVAIEVENSSTQFNVYGIPETDCAISTPQLLKTRTLSSAVILGTTPLSLGHIQYDVPSGDVAFFSSSGTPLSNAEITLNFQSPKGTLNKTITIDNIRGYPELTSL